MPNDQSSEIDKPRLSISHQFSSFFIYMMWYRIFYGVVRICIAFAFLGFIGMPVFSVLSSILPESWLVQSQSAASRLLHYLLGYQNLKVTNFIIVYLGFWGIFDIVLSACILRHRLWAYPLSMWLIAIFIGYELMRLTQTHSCILLFFIIVDLLMLWLIWREYRRLKI